jgi:FKBP-type peptidyl-prolyl cis-trans isomerase FklB
MKTVVAVAVLFTLLLWSPVQAQDKLALKEQKDKLSYSIGVDIGKTVKALSFEVNLDAITQGVRDAITGAKTVLTEDEMRTVMGAFQKEMVAKEQERIKTLAEKNKKDEDAFLAENKKKEGVVTLPSGLQYKVLKEGSGQMPKADNTVVVHYRGRLLDGSEFDSSYKRGEPATFPVNGVIPGWTEALQLMKTGSQWQVFIPSKLAYGENGAGNIIGPNATLIFDVELISIK